MVVKSKTEGKPNSLRVWSTHVATLVVLIAAPFVFINLGGYVQWVTGYVYLYLIQGYVAWFLFFRCNQPFVGYAVTMAVGAYGTILLTVLSGWPMWLAMLFSAILSGVLAALIFGATSRARGFYVTMVSFLLTIVFPSVVVALGDITGGARGFSFGDQSLESTLGFNTLVWLIVLTAVGIVAIIFWLLQSETGRVLAVMAENDDLTQALGIKTFNYKILAYAISGFFSGLGGALYVNYTGSMSSADLNVFTTILITFIPIIGGTRIYGPFLGTLFVTLVPEFFSSIESYLDIIFGLVFIVVVLGVRGGIGGCISDLLDRVPKFRRG